MSSKNRWTITRIGLINFWYYDEQEFLFNDGKLLLRGSNGSGKSVTMQSFIPLLFDGNKSPERLDPFGSRARKLENYLLGEDEKDKEENTGYLYMEFVKPESGIYLTIGMGLKAKRGRPVEFWGFCVTDGRRVGSELMLYKDIGDKIPLSKLELRYRIGEGGEVHESQREYMAMVNKHLFGYEDLEEYDELIKLLVQIRTPKLSKEFRPTVIYEIMNNSLQPLSDDDLRPLSEAIENMDKIRDQLEMLKESKKAADRLRVEYDKYNRFILLEKAREYLNAWERLENAKKEARRLEEEGLLYQQQHKEAEEERESLIQQRESLEHRKGQLEQHDGFKAKQEIVRLEAGLGELEGRKQEKEAALGGKKERLKSLDIKLREEEGRKESQESEITGLIEEMGELAEDFYFDEHQFAADEMKSDLLKPYDFKLFKAETDRYRGKISNARKALGEQQHAERAYDMLLQELEHARRDRDIAARELEKSENLFDETKEEFTEKVFTWEKGNTYLKIPHEEMPEVVRAVNSYGTEGSYDDIKEKVRRHFVKCEGLLNKRISEHEGIRKEHEALRKQKQQELESWRDKKEPEPQRAEKAELRRRKLEAAGIPFIPFYKAVDFKQDTSPEMRGKLEEALYDMGLLDALIIPRKHLDNLPDMAEEEGDRYIRPNPQFFKQELSLFLEPVVPRDSGITFEDIDNVLKSILVDDKSGGTYVTEKGEYSIGLLQGRTTSVSAPRFLGLEARKRYRQQIMDALEEEIRQLKLLIEEQDSLISGTKQEMRLLEGEFAAFPGRMDLETAFSTLDGAKKTLEARENEVIRRQSAADKAYGELKLLRDKVREMVHGMQIPVTLKDYEEAERNSGLYRDKLSGLETLHERLLATAQSILALGEQREDISQDIDALWKDLHGIKREMEAMTMKKQNLEQVLLQTDYESIKAEVESCIKELAQLPQKLEAAIRRSQKNKNLYEEAVKNLENILKQTEAFEKLVEVAKESFRLEYNLGYVIKASEQYDLLAAAKKAVAELKSEDKNVRMRDEYTSGLHDKYRENMQYLVEYNLRIDTAFEGFKQDEDEAVTRLMAMRKRLELMAKVQGRDVDFYTMSDFIQQSIEENEKLLKESDRQLFEDILANTVGKKIRAKIYHSEQWVNKINSLMESMNTSSGLSFSLMWKKKPAETEEQLDTRELVGLLQSDAVLLTEEDMTRLTSHFRSKIAQARKSMEDMGRAQSFHTIMKDILDYRKWFEFQLFYKKTGETRKELTDNAFFKFSGGEKAMAMYVPLFSSVYARFDAAPRKDCPRVISLDEAFAGVDDNNIADMFRLVEELKLDYVINSQVLWGDYATVPALSIYELIRPNNADFVTTIRYNWNGQIRQLAG